MKLWRKCTSKRLWRVNFALGADVVRKLATHVYCNGLIQVGGRVFHVEDVLTGHQDFVGEEYLKSIRS